MATVTITNNSAAINSAFLDTDPNSGTLIFPESLRVGLETDGSFNAKDTVEKGLPGALQLLSLIPDDLTLMLDEATGQPVSYTEGGVKYWVLTDSTQSIYVDIATASAPNLTNRTGVINATAVSIWINGDFVTAKGTISMSLAGGVQSTSSITSVAFNDPRDPQDYTGELELKGTFALGVNGWTGTISSGTSQKFAVSAPPSEDPNSPSIYLTKSASVTLASPVSFNINNSGIITFSSDPAITSFKETLTQVIDSGASSTKTDIFTVEFTALSGVKFSTQVDRSLASYMAGGNDSITINQTGTAKTAIVAAVGANAGNDAITGSFGADELYGDLGDDTINAAGGNDTLDGGLGSDSLSGGDGADLIRATRPQGVPSLFPWIERDTIDGGAGNDLLEIGFTRDQVVVAPSSSTAFEIFSKDLSYSASVTGVEGVNFADGVIQVSDLTKSSVEYPIYGSSNDNITVPGATFVHAGAGNDTVTGSSESDTLMGGDGGDRLIGGDGDDYLIGGAGNDTLIGGDGNDVYVVDGSTDQITEVDVSGNNQGWDEVYFTGTGTYALGAGSSIEFVRYGGIDEMAGIRSTTAFNATGNEVGQAILGNAAANSLAGGGGDDMLGGYAGNDTLDGGAGNDLLIGGGGNDSMSGGADANTSVHFLSWDSYGDSVKTAIKDSGADAINLFETAWLSSGSDTFNGGAGEDTALVYAPESSITFTKDASGRLVLSRGSESLTLIEVENVAFFGTPLNEMGESAFRSTDGANIVSVSDLLSGAASSGNDLLYTRGTVVYDSATKTYSANPSAQYPTLIDGGAGNDTIYGTGAIVQNPAGMQAGDGLYGGDGNDSLVGFAGADLLDGGAGVDTMDGGEGADLYVVDNVGDVIKGETSVSAPATLLDGQQDALQVRGDISYTLAEGQAIGFLTAGNFLKDAFIAGQSQFWDFSVTNKANIKGNSFGQQFAGNAAANKLEGMGGDDTIWGAAGNDTLDGGTGNDSLDGSVGDDSIFGGAGNDLLVGDHGDWNDATSTYGYGGKDTLDGGEGVDTAFMQYGEYGYKSSKSNGDLILTNIANPNSVTTIKSSVEYIMFNRGEGATPILLTDLLAEAASSGNDLLYKRNTVLYDSATKSYTADPSVQYTVLIDGGAGNDTIYGTGGTVPGADREFGDGLYGGDGNDSLVGFAGPDLLDGGAGVDTMIGGDGADLYVVDNAADVILGETSATPPAPGQFQLDALQVRGDTSYALAEGQAIWLLSAGDFLKDAFIAGQSQVWDFSVTNKANIKGNSFGQQFMGNAAANKLEGMGGDDSLWGAAGNDTLDGGTGDDTLDGSVGDDSIQGGTGNDLLVGDHGLWSDATSTYGFGGKDTLDGGDGNADVAFMQYGESSYKLSKANGDLILTNNANANSVTTIKSSVEYIKFNRGEGEDGTLMALSDLLAGAASSSDDILYKRGTGSYNASNKTFTISDSAPASGFTIDGQGGNDAIFGTNLSDSLLGGEGNDTLTGLGDDDLLDGGAGGDVLRGGEGRDTLSGGAGNDTMVGGTGHDRYWIDSAGDVVVEILEADETNIGPERDEDVAIVAANWTSGADARLEVLIAAGELAKGLMQMSGTVAEAKVDITGNGYDESLVGSGAANKLDGGAGDDSLFGSDGADTLLGGAGSDWLAGGAGNDSLSGGVGDDMFLFNVDDKLLNAGAGFTVADALDRTTGGIDTIEGGEGNDVIALSGSESDYTITRISQTDYVITANAALPGAATKESATFRGIERLVFGVTNPEEIGSLPTVQLAQLGIPSDFDDVLSPRNGSVRFDRNGGKGNDSIVGSGVGDSLVGGEGNDTLGGGGGNDTLIGGAGNDVLLASRPAEPPAQPELITMDGGAGDDLYIIDDPFVSRVTTIADSAGNDTLRMNVYGRPNIQGYIDGATKKLVMYSRVDTESGAEFSAQPIVSADMGVIETLEAQLYRNVNDTPTLVDTLRYNVVYAAQDAKTGIWNAKGTDKADVLLATIGGPNVYDGGKGDDEINIFAHAASVAQGGEGFNQISVRYGLPGAEVPNVPMGTLSYAWSAGGVEVNMEAGIGIAYDAKGEEVLGVDQFEGLANLLGSKSNDSLIGDGNNNAIDGSDGNDTLAGGGGRDLLIGGAGNDTFIVDVRDAGTIASERITPTTANTATLALEGGTDAKGTDTLVVRGAMGVGELRFEVGTQAIKVGLADAEGTVSYTVLADRAIEQVAFDFGGGSGPVYATTWGNLGTKGNDLVLAKASGGYALGGQGDDIVLGSAGEDLLLGGAGNDLLVGRDGEDRLLGGAGNDVLQLNRNDGDLVLGGSGSDTFVVRGALEGSAGYASRVLDFRLNEDFLRFEGYAGVRLSVAGQDAITQTAGSTDPAQLLSVTIDGGGQLRFGPQADPGAEVEVHLVGLAGIDTLAELNALAGRVLAG